MPTTRDESGRLHLGGVDLGTLARDPTVGTPAYVYDLDAMAGAARALRAAFEGAPHLVAYAVKANSAGPVIRTLAAEGYGADVVSGAELQLALACGIDPARVVYSGVAKQDWEVDLALASGPGGIGALQVESIEELERVEARAASLRRKARVSLRINPALDRVDLGTHVHVATGHDEAKFGIALEDVPRAIERVQRGPRFELVGFTVHVGSQFTSLDPYLAAARSLFAVVREARPALRALSFVDTGGGFGVDYGQGCAVRPADFVRAVRAEQRSAGLEDLALHVEPGRSLVAAHGVLLARVIQDKRSHSKGGGELRWIMIDAGMNDLLRPALYQARHRIVPLDARFEGGEVFRVVGPVCESADDFGVATFSGEPPGEVAILDAGAYGYTMASRYNGRPLPAEVFLRGGKVATVCPRKPIDEWAKERAGIPG